VGEIVVRTLLSVVNLDQRPAPHVGWAEAIRHAMPGVLLLCALAAMFIFVRRRDTSGTPATAPRSVIAFGAAWTVIGWLPLLAPPLGWHAYYGLFGALGAWLVLATWLAPHRVAAIATVAAIAIIGGGRVFTSSRDWGTAWYQNRASNFVRVTRDYFKSVVPAFPSHSRIYLSGVPNGVGLIPGEESPLLQFWYGDTTLRAYFVSKYRPRSAGEPAGPRLFLPPRQPRGLVAGGHRAARGQSLRHRTRRLRARDVEARPDR
jgi:hypothetical protein